MRRMKMQTYSIDNISKYTDAHHPTTKYALEVVNGFRVAGEYEILSCKRHLNEAEHRSIPLCF